MFIKIFILAVIAVLVRADSHDDEALLAVSKRFMPFSPLAMAESIEDDYASIRAHIWDHPESEGKLKPLLVSMQTTLNEIDKAEFQATMKLQASQIPLIIDEIIYDVKFVDQEIKDNLDTIKRTKTDYNETLRRKLFYSAQTISSQSVRKLKHVQASIDAHKSLFKDFAATEKSLTEATSELDSFLKNLHLGEVPRPDLSEERRMAYYEKSFAMLAAAIKKLGELETQLKKQTL